MTAAATTDRAIPAARWHVKKAARIAVAAASAPFALAPRRARGEGVRVLTYHRFGDDRRDPFTVTAAAFERQMTHLAGRAVPLEDLHGFLFADAVLPPDAVLVTIDDGDPSVFDVALPVLRRHGVPAVAFVLADIPNGFEVMAAWQVRALAEAGVTIGSHSLSHRSLARLPRREMLREARDSRRRLEDLTGRAVRAFAYPFGTRADFSAAAGEALREAGYDLAFTSQHGAVRRQSDALELPRVKVEGGDPDWHFPALCRGGMDAWRLVDAGLHRLQRPSVPPV